MSALFSIAFCSSDRLLDAIGQALAGAVQPTRTSVPSSVERGTLKVRQTDDLGAYYCVAGLLVIHSWQARPSRAPRREHNFYPVADLLCRHSALRRTLGV